MDHPNESPAIHWCNYQNPEMEGDLIHRKRNSKRNFNEHERESITLIHYRNENPHAFYWKNAEHVDPYGQTHTQKFSSTWMINWQQKNRWNGWKRIECEFLSELVVKWSTVWIVLDYCNGILKQVYSLHCTLHSMRKV